MPLFRAARVARFAVLLLAALLIAQGCATTIPGRARQGDGIVTADVDTADVDTAVVHGSRGGPIDEVATATLLDMQSYWRATFEPAFRVPWRGLSGGFYSVDTGDPVAPPPPCMDAAARLEGNALYCPSADAVVWDRSALLPVLRMRYGDGGVMVVLAHEVGHAVHNRLGIDPVRMRHQPNRYPTILTEAMADCYAGSFVRWVVDGHAEHLRLDQQELDRTLSALVTFRDPAGTSATDASAHGNAFDRVSAFQDGYQQGAGLCARFTVANRTFTQQRSTSLKDLEAIGRHGNLPFDRLIGAITPDLADYFARLVTHRGGHWQAPLIRAEQTTPACSAEQGPIAFCPADGTVELDPSGELPELHTHIGDYATAALLAGRYSLAALRALGRPTEGETAQRSMLCLTGAYTGTLLARTSGFRLSPGDLDEAVQMLLSYDYSSRDLAGHGLASGFARVSAFRSGTLDGPEACDL